MNFQTLNRQRKLIMICAIIGLIASFLPWATISAGMFGVNMSQHYNGFSGVGTWTFICFLATLLLCLPGDQSKNLNQSIWLVCFVLASIAALLVILVMTNKKDDGGFGIVEARIGIGAWLALAASLGILILNWMYRQPGDTLASSFESLKKDIPFKIASTEQPVQQMQASSEKNNVQELEKLIELKNKGHITEEEYQQLKSKII